MAISRSRIAVAMLVVLGWAAVAHAEDASPPPTGTRLGALAGTWAGAGYAPNAVT